MALHEILPNTLMAPREARIAIERFLSKAQLSQLTDDAQLLASELVTNAVRHASGPIDVRAYVRDGFLRLEVGDSWVDHAPQPRHADPRTRAVAAWSSSTRCRRDGGGAPAATSRWSGSTCRCRPGTAPRK